MWGKEIGKWLAEDTNVRVLGGGIRVSPAGVPIEQVLGEYSFSQPYLAETQLYSIPPEPRMASEIGGSCLRSIS